MLDNVQLNQLQSYVNDMVSREVDRQLTNRFQIFHQLQATISNNLSDTIRYVSNQDKKNEKITESINSLEKNVSKFDEGRMKIQNSKYELMEKESRNLQFEMFVWILYIYLIANEFVVVEMKRIDYDDYYSFPYRSENLRFFNFLMEKMLPKKARYKLEKYCFNFDLGICTPKEFKYILTPYKITYHDIMLLYSMYACWVRPYTLYCKKRQVIQISEQTSQEVQSMKTIFRKTIDLCEVRQKKHKQLIEEMNDRIYKLERTMIQHSSYLHKLSGKSEKVFGQLSKALKILDKTIETKLKQTSTAVNSVSSNRKTSLHMSKMNSSRSRKDDTKLPHINSSTNVSHSFDKEFDNLPDLTLRSMNIDEDEQFLHHELRRNREEISDTRQYFMKKLDLETGNIWDELHKMQERQFSDGIISRQKGRILNKIFIKNGANVELNRWSIYNVYKLVGLLNKVFHT
ncbi:hypothetical protein SNEBB_001021 [Seison nebaliae]|nr:hypothetical protein SNEBB_001021 [Seison nebaliae]